MRPVREICPKWHHCSSSYEKWLCNTVLWIILARQSLVITKGRSHKLTILINYKAAALCPQGRWHDSLQSYKIDTLYIPVKLFLDCWHHGFSFARHTNV
jgi:hypothetical protein